jgi:hypothetical protein
MEAATATPVKAGKIQATEPTDDGTTTDQSLPDPTVAANATTWILIALALAAAIVAKALDWDHASFSPATKGDVDFTFFAGFAVAAQVIERLLELVAPLLPLWAVPGDGPTAKAAQAKADRSALTGGLGVLIGVVVSLWFGLYFLQAVGISTPRWVDIFATALVISAGSKSLHGVISSLQKQTTPPTGSAA